MEGGPMTMMSYGLGLWNLSHSVGLIIEKGFLFVGSF